MQIEAAEEKELVVEKEPSVKKKDKKKHIKEEPLSKEEPCTAQQFLVEKKKGRKRKKDTEDQWKGALILSSGHTVFQLGAHQMLCKIIKGD